jgi:threonine dehydrogenase-like Zn-dependent dehydrogenase
MRALVLDDHHTLTLQELPFEARHGECTIRVLAAGICGTDLQLLNGYANFVGIPGHEFVGVVDAVSDPHDAHWLGQRVVGEINVGCGTCPMCRAGVKEHCPTRTVVGIHGRSGAFAELLSLPAVNLHRVPDEIDDETAVFVEPVAAACRILEQVAVTNTTQAAVLGDGRLGQLIAQVLRTATDHVTLVGRHAHKLATAESLGITAVDAGTTSLLDGFFDVVVDATGRAETLQRAIALARPRGTVVMKTTAHAESLFTSWPAVVNEVTLVGSRCGPFGEALKILDAGQVQTRPLVAGTYPLEAYSSAFDAARSALKVLFAIS